jgi:hypothetical protein
MGLPGYSLRPVPRATGVEGLPKLLVQGDSSTVTGVEDLPKSLVVKKGPPGSVALPVRPVSSPDPNLLRSSQNR